MSSAEIWDERYSSSGHQHVWSGQPNPTLVAEVAALEHGRALDVGCGEGADVIWLAEHGWDVVGIDVSVVALERAAAHVADTAPELADRIRWQQADLVADPPEPQAFDLATAHFVHEPSAQWTTMFRGLVAAVRPGGTLLVVGHDPSDVDSGVGRPHDPDVYFSAADVTDLLDDSWDVTVSESRPRPATTPDGADATVRDLVVLAGRTRT